VSAGPSLSVVLVTDVLATIEPVLARLRAQTVVDRLELVIATPQPDTVREEISTRDGFASIVVAGVDGLVPLATARAVGVRSASAPLVFLGETHTYPEPRWAEALIAAHQGDWAAVVPGFANGNPSGALSWAGFLSDYGAWLACLQSRELSFMPIYNTAYKRATLLELDSELERLLTSDDHLLVHLRASGRVLFDPSAIISHVNVASPWAWLTERYYAGLLTARNRVARWPLRRRLLYAVGSPLIPLVLLVRVVGGVKAARDNDPIPFATYPAMVVAATITALGELMGYLGIPAESAERRMTEYEIHRLRYAGA
jgi:hypothetical protein